LTPQEEQLLNSLIERVNQTQLQEKDSEAENLINQTLGPNPDALYILAQTVLVQNIALDQARAQIAQLQQQRPQHAHTTSFLGRLLGEHDQPQTQQQQAPPPYQPVPQYAAPQAQPYPPYGQPPYAQPQYVPMGGQPSFLRGAMQTAAGVAAGALAFEGVESILHGFGHGGYGPGYGMGGFGMGERPVEETVINNYYDEPGRGAEHAEHHLQDGSSAYGPHSNDPNDNLRGFEQNATAGNDQDANAFADASSLDDPAAYDDQNGDDGSGMDDSGSFDDGGGGFDDGGGGF
jgi:hypothetical protein